MNKTITNYCPYSKTSKSITIDYIRSEFCGDSNTYYTKNTFCCNSINECDYRNEDTECPLYEKAAESFTI